MLGLVTGKLRRLQVALRDGHGGLGDLEPRDVETSKKQRENAAEHLT